MKINPAIPSVGNAPDGGRARPTATATRRPSTEGEKVELSSLSAHLQEIGSAASASPVVDAQRVAEIKQAISEGRFQINPERIANGLLNSVRDMLAKNS